MHICTDAQENNAFAYSHTYTPTKIHLQNQHQYKQEETVNYTCIEKKNNYS